MSRTPERYASATNSSHLRVEPFPCDIDPIIAAGWVKVGLSTELYRLTVELDSADQRPLLGVLQTSRMDHAMLSARVRSMAPVRRELTGYAHWLRRTRFHEVPLDQVLNIALAVLYQLLFPACPVCTGRKYQVIANTPNLSHKACRGCDATGLRRLRVPGGRAGYEFAAALEVGINAKMQVLFEVMARHLRNQLDLPIGTTAGNGRITEHCEAVLRDNPNDGAASRVLQRTREVNA
jgi:hypothetical protein